MLRIYTAMPFRPLLKRTARSTLHLCCLNQSLGFQANPYAMRTLRRTVVTALLIAVPVISRSDLAIRYSFCWRTKTCTLTIASKSDRSDQSNPLLFILAFGASKTPLDLSTLILSNALLLRFHSNRYSKLDRVVIVHNTDNQPASMFF